MESSMFFLLAGGLVVIIIAVVVAVVSSVVSAVAADTDDDTEQFYLYSQKGLSHWCDNPFASPQEIRRRRSDAFSKTNTFT